MTAVEGEAQEARRRRDITVAEIARLAGVSAPTVSKVLNGHARVALATRQRIEEIINTHGYRRRETVTATPIVEILFHALDSLWALEIIRGVERVGAEHGMAVALTEMRGRHTPGKAWAEQVLTRRPVGIIGVGATLTTEQLAQLHSRRIPLVILDPSGEPVHQTPSVGAMNWNGGLVAARHLVELGHRRIAMINGPQEYLCCRARLDGYRAALDAGGVPSDPLLVRNNVPLTAEGGVAAAVELLRLPDPPTAIFTANDVQALGVYEAARRAGLRVPQDVSVVGFDDQMIAQWSLPPLTTVRQPLQRMGMVATEMVLTLAGGGQPESERVELPTTLVVRESTAPPWAR